MKMKKEAERGGGKEEGKETKDERCLVPNLWSSGVKLKMPPSSKGGKGRPKKETGHSRMVHGRYSKGTDEKGFFGQLQNKEISVPRY